MTQINQDSLLEEPTPPEDWECCGSECGEYCVLEIYRREKLAYDAQQRALKLAEQLPIQNNNE